MLERKIRRFDIIYQGLMANDRISMTAAKTKHPQKTIPTPETMDRHKLPGHSHNIFSAYCYYPDHVNFSSADNQEKVVLMLRRHPITNLKWVLSVFFLSFIPILLPGFIPENFLPLEYILVISLSWYLLLSAFTLERFLAWFFNVNIVTDERVFDVDFTTIFHREITDANLDQIQDVTVEVGGAVQTFFHFGDVVIQTAGETPRIRFEMVPDPDRVAMVLRELRIEEEVEKMEGRVR